MKIDVEKLKALRTKTAASYMECRNALVEAKGDLEEAEKLVRKKGLAVVESEIITKTDEGVICSYVHPGDRVGVLLEVKCKTDFVAKTEEFKQFAREIAMQVAAMKPRYVSRADVPLDVISEEVGFRIDRLARDGVTEKSEEYQKLLDAEMDHWYAEICLLEQVYVRDGKKNVKDLLAELVSKVDETCRITRFERWEIGQEEPEAAQEESFEIVQPDNKFKLFASLMLIALFALILIGIFGG